MVKYWTRSCSCGAGEGDVRSGRCSVLLAPLFHFISVAVTRGSSPLLFLTVSPPFSGELLEMSLCSILRCPSLILLLCLSSPPPTLSFLSLLTLLPSPWILFVLQSFASSVTFVHAYLPLSLVVTLLSSMRADISGAIRQVVRCSFTRLRETRDEKRNVRVARHRRVMRDLQSCH